MSYSMRDPFYNTRYTDAQWRDAEKTVDRIIIIMIGIVIAFLLNVQWQKHESAKTDAWLAQICQPVHVPTYTPAPASPRLPHWAAVEAQHRAAGGYWATINGSFQWVSL